MKAWHVTEPGQITLSDVPDPTPGPNEIVVRTQAVSLNFRDSAVIRGTYHDPVKLPLVPGSDLAGEVVSSGSAVTRFKQGDRVVSTFKPDWIDGPPDPQTGANLGSPLPGVLSEYVVLSEQGAVRVPDYLTPAEASTLPIAAVTAWVSLFEKRESRAGDIVLVHGSGGVSLFGLQLAVAAGARVIATSRSPGKASRLKELGASDVIDTMRNPQWDEQVLSLTNGQGVNQVLEVVGGDSVQRSINSMATGGHLAMIGLLESPSAMIQTPSLFMKQITLDGISVGSRKHMSNLLAFMQAHHIKPVIDATYDFTELSKALKHLDRGTFGKVVLEVR
jgi:NADPH:quinone reductase-like Zn-dependent oxidoreductase